MRTRSSRLFLILLHLVSVSTDIGGVHNPRAILLQRIQLPREGLHGIPRQDVALSDPFWLQDTIDGLCLSPAGFSQCGETTLWYIRGASQHQTTQTRRRRRRPIELGYALEYVEPTQDGECILSSPPTRSLSSKTIKSLPESLDSCHSSLDRVFRWNVNEHGVLHTKQDNYLSDSNENEIASQCLWRLNTTSTVLSSCMPSTTDSLDDVEEQGEGRRLVHLSLLRYVPESVAREREKRILEEEAAVAKAAIAVAAAKGTVNETNKPEEAAEHIPRSIDSARRHASEPLHHAEVKSTGKKPLGSVVKTVVAKKTKLFTLKDTNPILFIGDQGVETKPSTRASSSSLPASFHKRRRLETHPYLAAAKNNVWTDPQTGLEYPTDLCAYLGHDLKKAGRHTLTGVGYYTKTVLNIKIYGVALYISKKDALADPVFERYAASSADELRRSLEFYDHLREMPSPLDPKSGLVDRTILLKLNMQLSMETMQSSLRATWKLLTEERKNLLINSSMQPRPAEERMLRTIQSPQNPGRCSCGQVAPPEYNADRECCARGTELVFTWRKNGDLEIRVDGRIMDSFPRPDVARGIFYEYLRTDDPISPDFTNRVVEGFPFLLGPLAQVKGMPAAMQSNDTPKQERGIIKAVGNFADSMSNHAGEFAGWVHNGATGAAGNVANAAKSLGSTANSVKEGLERRRDQLWSQVSTFPENGMHFLQKKMQLSRRADELAASELQMKRRTAVGPRGRVFRSSVSHWFDGSEEIGEQLENVRFQGSFFGNLIFFYLVHLYLLLLLIVSLPGTHQTKLVLRRSKVADESMTDDLSTESSSTDESPSRNRLPSTDTWTIGNEPLTHKQPGKNLVSIFKERRRRSRSRGRSSDDEGNTSSIGNTGMKKSLSYYL